MWRYEIECKGDAAEIAARLVRNMDNHPTPIAAAVYRWYTARGVQCRYRPDMPGESLAVGRDETDTQRKLRWLSRQVAPVVEKLLGMYPERDLYALLFSGLDPKGMRPLDRKEDLELDAYDQWSIETRTAQLGAAPHRSGRSEKHG
jgi:hypothetical protein